MRRLVALVKLGQFRQGRGAHVWRVIGRLAPFAKPLISLA
ncbi:hypothetical protein CNE_1c07320 [Cupriavidus necator N-1]|uniref:Uncharacterized protein n=1 Tax=Cupriavidus necator (strain ATCC 43291 / DSM 13513 / CCUG 52238 / LMG 8453 / N-1) TaxID=1042878 RepID=G0EXJ1_CUPNN|nr:hypothetical protein CNE_1c07320 [Cupriavidus necator N-1]KAI3609141.1 hypothetical protein D8I24_0919 [Cupriavidus necator H850]